MYIIKKCRTLRNDNRMIFNKRINVLLATFNGKIYIKEQLDSLFSQTYKNIEIIVRDDGSSDNTIEILKSYNIKPIDTKINLGAMGSFEELLKYAFKIVIVTILCFVIKMMYGIQKR